MSIKPKNAAINQAVERGLALLMDKHRGEYVSWAELESSSGIRHGTSQWSWFYGHLCKRFFAATGISLRMMARHGDGVMIPKVADQLGKQVASRHKRARRQLGRSKREIEAIPDDDMTDRERVLRSQQLEATETSLAKIRSGAAAVAAALRGDS